MTISLPEATVSEIDLAAAAAGIDRAEWIRQACTQKITAGNFGENIGRIEAERDQLAVHIRTLEALARKDAAAIRRAAHDIEWYRSEVQQLKDENLLPKARLPPIALPEKAGPSAGRVEAAAPVKWGFLSSVPAFLGGGRCLHERQRTHARCPCDPLKPHPDPGDCELTTSSPTVSTKGG